MEINKLKENLVLISSELNLFDVDREKLFTWCINKKLENSMQNYNEAVTEDVEFILVKRNNETFRALAQNKKNSDKQFLDDVINKKGKREVKNND